MEADDIHLYGQCKDKKTKRFPLDCFGAWFRVLAMYLFAIYSNYDAVQTADPVMSHEDRKWKKDQPGGSTHNLKV